MLNEAELAHELGEEPRTIRSWRLSGVIPAVILGARTIRFRLPNVIAALEKRTCAKSNHGIRRNNAPNEQRRLRFGQMGNGLEIPATQEHVGALTLHTLPSLLTDCVLVGHAQKADVVFTPPQWFATCVHMMNDNPDIFFSYPISMGRKGRHDSLPH